MVFGDTCIVYGILQFLIMPKNSLEHLSRRMSQVVKCAQTVKEEETTLDANMRELRVVQGQLGDMRIWANQNNKKVTGPQWHAMLQKITNTIRAYTSLAPLVFLLENPSPPLQRDKTVHYKTLRDLTLQHDFQTIIQAVTDEADMLSFRSNKLVDTICQLNKSYHALRRELSAQLYPVKTIRNLQSKTGAEAWMSTLMSHDHINITVIRMETSH